MKQWVIILLAILFPLVRAQSQELLTVSGIVVNGADGNALPLCRVQLISDKTSHPEGYSDYAGNYLIRDVKPGVYTLLITQFGDTLMHYKGLTLTRDTWVRSVVLPPSENELSDVPQHIIAGLRTLRSVLIYSHRHSQLAKMGLLISSPDDPRLWNFSGHMDDLFEPEKSFWWGRYKMFYSLRKMGYQITSPFELVHPEVYRPASDSVDYKIWILGFRF